MGDATTPQHTAAALAPVPADADPVASLHEMFPMYERDVISAVWYACDRNVEETLAYLLESTGETDAPPTTTPLAPPTAAASRGSLVRRLLAGATRTPVVRSIQVTPCEMRQSLLPRDEPRS
jgi:hypothetical protein